MYTVVSVWHVWLESGEPHWTLMQYNLNRKKTSKYQIEWVKKNHMNMMIKQEEKKHAHTQDNEWFNSLK